MAYIKKLVMHGFKSFAKRTEIPFENGINVIIGPNGSGKSNISDAICFALGRLSAKSMRAEKGTNLIFMGSKYIKPAHEAYVELVFDNTDRAFALETNEVVVKRSIRSKGASVYKINDDVKTRAEVIETLAQAGIDPYGFNMILQGQIQSIVRMQTEERRKIIGEVAGISVYEWRKEKSLKELEKTEERLKEINTILRERTAQLNNLERERAQAKKFKELEMTVKRSKATITRKKLDEKEKEINSIVKAIEEKLEQKQKQTDKSEKLQEQIEGLSEKIGQINKHIREASGVEQSQLRDGITNLKAELEGMRVRKEGQENRREEIERRIKEMSKSLPDVDKEIQKLREESPLVAKKAQELKKKKEDLAELEKERKRFFSLKTEVESLRERISDRKSQLSRTFAESDSLLRQIDLIANELEYRTESESSSALEKLRKELESSKLNLEKLNREEIENEKIISVALSEIERNEKIRSKVEEIDVCPLCQSKITEDHIKHVFEDCQSKIEENAEKKKNSEKKLAENKETKKELREAIIVLETSIRKCEKDLISVRNVEEKKNGIKNFTNHSETLKKEISELEAKIKGLENRKDDLASIEERYKEKMLEIEEISSRTEENVDMTLMYKERELERTRNIIDKNKQDLEDISGIIKTLGSDIEQKEVELEQGEKKEEELNARFKKMFNERDDTQKQIQEFNLKLSEMQSETRQIEDQINYLKIGKSKIDGEKQVIEMDFADFAGIELLQGSVQSLEEKMKKAQESLLTIGSINMRALEVYDEIKVEYDKVREKADTIDREKNEIMKIIEEIDKKKKKTFMRTFTAINELFSRNFSRLSAKGVAYLELENQEEIFEGGVEIVVKMAKGKYFDVHSLSGGEQTLVALSLLFAIQEYKPYHFYILDEIDAALDKRNSERLAGLLNQYTKSGQYIVVTHNDAIILDSDILYGVSMHEGVSKILSLRIKEMSAAAKTSEAVKENIEDESLKSENESGMEIDELRNFKSGEVNEAIREKIKEISRTESEADDSNGKEGAEKEEEIDGEEDSEMEGEKTEDV
jgi:chromosome segregation protein